MAGTAILGAVTLNDGTTNEVRYIEIDPAPTRWDERSRLFGINRQARIHHMGRRDHHTDCIGVVDIKTKHGVLFASKMVTDVSDVGTGTLKIIDVYSHVPSGIDMSTERCQGGKKTGETRSWEGWCRPRVRRLLEHDQLD